MMYIKSRISSLVPQLYQGYPEKPVSNGYNTCMRRFIYILSIFILVACRAISPFGYAGAPGLALQTSPVVTAIPPSATLTATITPTLPPTATATPQPTFTPTFTPTPTLQPGYTVWFHPDNGLYVGDQVSMEVISPPNTEMKGHNVLVQVDPPSGPKLGPTDFGTFGIENRSQATLTWAWDTSNESTGAHTLSFTVRPEGPTWTETVTLLPKNDLPPFEAQAHWATAKSQCCELHFITGTAAGRDIQSLAQQADQQAQDAASRLQVNFTQPISITLLPRVLGNGGFTSDEISISYLDRNYASSNFDLVLHHEMIHALDGRMGGDLRPSILVEGLAVYMSGGHFKKEPLLPRTAALLQIPAPGPPGSQPGKGWYIPLKTLAEDFYASQHEIGYLEAAALIQYMVDTWGWSAYNSFYRDIHPLSNGSQVDAIDIALRKHFQISFVNLEYNFLQFLGKQPVDAATIRDIQSTVGYYDTMRRYQKDLDPSAHFRTAWLLDNKEMRKRGIVADYLRHPNSPENLALETLLVSAGDHLLAGQLDETDANVAAVNAALGAWEQKQASPFLVSPLASDYLDIVQALLADGDEPQRIVLDGDTARAWVSSSTSPDLIQRILVRRQQGWVLGS